MTISSKHTLFLLLLALSIPAMGQMACSPFMGIGNGQFFDNSGTPLTNGVLYSFQAGTSTQQATFTDSTCTIQNVNPITFGTGARATIWLTTANFYKFQLCAQNDGPACAAGDVLFSVDQVPGGATGGGGGGGSPFISGSANPATSGILRLATGDAICWKNTANSSNLCFSKDTSDLLSWAGGSFKLPEVGAPAGVTGFDILYADNTAHRWKQCSNGSTCAQIANAGVDISATDQVTQVHFGGTATPLSATAPASGGILQWNGTNIIGTYAVIHNDLLAQNTNCAPQTLTTPAANGYYRITATLYITTAAGTSSTTPVIAATYTDADTSSTETITPLAAQSSLNTVGVVAGGTPNGFFAKSGVAITVTCVGYASNPANAMQYSLHTRLEGPF